MNAFETEQAKNVQAQSELKDEIQRSRQEATRALADAGDKAAKKDKVMAAKIAEGEAALAAKIAEGEAALKCLKDESARDKAEGEAALKCLKAEAEAERVRLESEVS